MNTVSPLIRTQEFELHRVDWLFIRGYKFLFPFLFYLCVFVQDLVHTCTRLMIGDFNNSPSYEVSAGENLKSPCALIFNTTLVKLTSKLLSLRPYQYNIQANFACYVQDVDHKKVERFLVYWLLPLCIRMGTGRYGKTFMFMTMWRQHFLQVPLTFNSSP